MTTLTKQFSDEQLSRVLDQSLIHQCACPAQVCKSIIGLRELHEYEVSCLDQTENDEKVHSAIAAATDKCHSEMEKCLLDILEIEQWDLETLEMPDWLKNKTFKSL